MRPILHTLGKILLLLGMATHAHAANPLPSTLKVESLECEGRPDPLGVDVDAPALSWKLTPIHANDRSLRQTAYQIIAVESPDSSGKNRAELWDSGKVNSAETLHVTYAGKALNSSRKVYWKVRVWDQNNQPSAWSTPASWTMGILRQQDWGRAQWIGAPGDEPVSVEGPRKKYETVLLRREFQVKPGLKRAVVHACGLGQYEMRLNGGKVGDAWLTSGWTKYDKTCLYDTREITGSLTTGRNALGLFLDNGMYLSHRGRYIKEQGWAHGPLKAILLLRLEYGDGSTEVIVSDDSWKTCSGPITFSSPYGGEDFDARLEPLGWDRPGFSDTGWEAARLLAATPAKLAGTSCSALPIRAHETLKPIGQKQLEDGTTVYDLGQNASLIPVITVRGPAGSQVRIIPSELVKESGDIDDTMCGGKSWWSYTLRGNGTETWTPRFFYRGARYLKVVCIPAETGGPLPVMESITARVVHSASPLIGDFSSSSELFNRIHTLVRWAQRSNMMSVLTDCPTREKLGWLEQYHLNGPALRYSYDLRTVFSKAMNDMTDSQLADGLVPSIAPEYVAFGGNKRNDFGDSPEWGSSLLLVAWQEYQFNGDPSLLSRHYEAMKRYVSYLGTKAENHIVNYGLGDWYDIGPKHPGYSQLTPRALTATAYYYYDAWVLSQTASLLGKNEDATRYAQLAKEIRDAFNKEFFHPETGQYATGSQCANALPLVMNIAEPATRKAVLDNITADIRQKGLTAGDVGYQYLLRALADGGRSDVIHEMNQASDKPGYGMQLARGATSLTEAWDTGRSSSQNHFMLGQINEWFYHDLAGIQPDPAGPGFRKIIIRPAMNCPLGSVHAGYDSVRGKISSTWKKDAGGYSVDVTIPANTTAQVYLPANDAHEAHSIRESSLPADQAPGVKFLRMERESAVFAIGSGSYHFQSGTR
jgi:alpha-L-rhamnosidase